jgi:hypothetical protein
MECNGSHPYSHPCRITLPRRSKFCGQVFFLPLNRQLLCDQRSNESQPDQPKIFEIQASPQQKRGIGQIDRVAGPGEGACGDQIRGGLVWHDGGFVFSEGGESGHIQRKCGDCECRAKDLNQLTAKPGQGDQSLRQHAHNRCPEIDDWWPGNAVRAVVLHGNILVLAFSGDYS